MNEKRILSDFSLSHIFYGISAIFHPLLLVTFATMILLYSQNYVIAIRPESKWTIIFVIFLLTFCVPFLSVLIFYFSGNISDWRLTNKADRFFPFLFTTIFYAISAYFFTYKFPLGILPHISNFLWSVSTCLLLVTIITHYWQISAHGVGMGGLLGFFVGIQMMTPSQDWQFWIKMIVFLLGLVLTARLYLEAHTPNQVWFGAGLGFVVCFLGQVLFF